MASNGKSSGQRIVKVPPALWNDMVSAGEAYRDSFFDQPDPGRTRPRSTDIVKVRNQSGSNLSAGQIVAFAGFALTDIEPEFIWLLSGQPQRSRPFGVLKRDTPSDEFGEAQVSGVCVSLVNILSTSHRYARVTSAGAYTLESAFSGPAEIVYAPSSTGEYRCVVNLAGERPHLVRFSLLADFDTGTASATIKDMTGTTIETASVLDPEGIFSDLVASDTGLAIEQSGLYYAIQAPCSSGEE